MEISKTKRILWKILEIREVGAVLPLLIAVILFTAKSDRFLTYDNMINVLRIASFTMICAIGECYLLISGSWDISIGAVYSLGGVIAGLAMTSMGLPIWLSTILALVAGGIIGLVNAFLVEKLEMPAFVATVGTQFIAKGLVQGITKGTPVYPLPDKFLGIGQTNLQIGSMGIPWVLVIAIVLSIIAGLILKYTTYGRKIYAVGGNKNAARFSGINVDKVLMIVYSISGFLAAFAGIIYCARMYSGQPTLGNGDETDAIAAVVLGGTSFSGGIGKIGGVIIGILIIAVLSNALNLLGINSFWQLVAKGVVILLAVCVDNIKTHKRVKG